MTAIILSILFSAAPQASAQTFEAAPAPQGETGQQEQPQDQNLPFVIAPVKPLEMPRAAQPQADQAPSYGSSAPRAPSSNASSNSTPKCQVGYELITNSSNRTVCSRKCPENYTRNEKGQCQSSNNMQSMMPAAGAAGESSSKNSADSQNGGAGGGGAGGGGSQKKCASKSGICGDTAREKDTAGKLTQFKEPGLQPGDGAVTSPMSTNDPSGLSRELGHIRSYSPQQLDGQVQSAAQKIETARSEFSAVDTTAKMNTFSAGLGKAYKSIGKSRITEIIQTAKADHARISQKINGINVSLANLKQAAVAMADSAGQTAKTLSNAVSQSAQADQKMTAAGQQLTTKINGAVQVHGQYGQFQTQFNATPPPPNDAGMRSAIMGQSQSAKAGFLTEDAQRASEQAVSAADQARGTLGSAESLRDQTKGAITKYEGQRGAAQSAVQQLMSESSGLGKTPVGDENAAARYKPVMQIVKEATSAIDRFEQTKKASFDPGWKETVQAMDSLAGMMDGKK